MVYQKQFFLKLSFSVVNSPTRLVLSTLLRKGLIISQVILCVFIPCKTFLVSELFSLSSINLHLSMLASCYFKKNDVGQKTIHEI